MEQFAAYVSALITNLLLWIGFGTMVGLLAKAILPGKDPGGAVATVFVGIVGSLLGAMTFFYFTGRQLAPISFAGFLVGMAGATLLLVTYRVLGGKVGMNMKWGWKKTRRRVSVTEDI